MYSAPLFVCDERFAGSGAVSIGGGEKGIAVATRNARASSSPSLELLGLLRDGTTARDQPIKTPRCARSHRLSGMRWAFLVRKRSGIWLLLLVDGECSLHTGAQKG